MKVMLAGNMGPFPWVMGCDPNTMKNEAHIASFHSVGLAYSVLLIKICFHLF